MGIRDPESKPKTVLFFFCFNKKYIYFYNSVIYFIPGNGKSGVVGTRPALVTLLFKSNQDQTFFIIGSSTSLALSTKSLIKKKKDAMTIN